MNVLSLFAGIGGIDLGLERAGMRIVGQVEIDPFCRGVLERHWPRVPRHDDVRTALRWWRREDRPDVDVVAAGFPCQPVSSVGYKRGEDDERWLWPDTVRIVRALRPAWTVLENVPGILRHGFGTVLGDLAAIGYDAEWHCLSACAFGAPHKRERVFIVAHTDDERRSERTGDERPGGWTEPTNRREWSAEPGVDRMAYGVPRRVDRVRSLGNAVVPQVAEHVGRAIVETHRGKR